MIRSTFLFLFAALGLHAQDGFTPLFNGKDLSGWVNVSCAPSTWTVVDGMLHCTGKPIGALRTDRMYQNFELELEWRHLKPRGNAGVFLWADDITARGQPFHRAVEVQVLENAYGQSKGHTTHGDIFPIHGARMKPVNGRGGSRAFPTEERSKPSPEWNHYRIVCNEGAISLAVNGKVVTQGTDCTPSKGYICLESEGGVVDYRNVRIKVLPDTPVDAADVAIADRGYRCLYNGVDLSGWEAPETGWQVKDWNLGATGESPIATSESFGDFGFIFDVHLTEKSGSPQVWLRGAEAAAIIVEAGKGWSRFEGEFRGGKLSLSRNGEQLLENKAIGGAPASGPIKLVPAGPTDWANIYVRDLK